MSEQKDSTSVTGEQHSISVPTYLAVFGALMVLTAVTVVSAHIDLGHFNIVVALIIAVTKATLVVTYFMHLRYGTNMTRAVLISGVIAVFLLMGIAIDDLRNRHTRTYLPFIGALNGVRPPNAPLPPHPPEE
ncbi:cytochrome C oxidase subunit IV family protein [Candidatus Binatia bacterium]|jgi:cytochrome c oxidase subunit 4|nr:cytochrome C oxidase subunit IV family protein [Candidatus Binatia bacterium]